jgi:Transposase DDE domain
MTVGRPNQTHGPYSEKVLTKWRLQHTAFTTTVLDTSTLKNHRNEYEYQGLVRLADALPAEMKVCVVADRGFGDHKLYQVLTEELKFDYVIRFRGNIHVTAADGEMRTAAAWVGRGGRARILRDALVTAERYQVGSVLCVQDKAMKQAWCLATGSTDETAKALMKLYGKRWGIECGFRDTKDLRFGMGMGSTHISTPERRGRLWLLNAFAIMLLTLLGAAAGTGVRSIPQVKHYQTAHSLAVPAGLHASRSDTQHAGGAAVAADRTVHCHARGTPRVCRYFRRGVKMRGVVSADTRIWNAVIRS